MKPTLSLQSSLTGLTKLYLIIIGLGVSEALSNIPEIQCNFTYVGYILLLVGYLSTVFRFMMKSFILYGRFIDNTMLHWRTHSFFAALFSFLTSIAFFLMGHHLQMFSQFIQYTLFLLLLDLGLIYTSHQPWQKGMAFQIQKILSILSFYTLYPEYNPKTDNTLDATKQQIKTTHYHWVRYDVFLFFALFSMLWFSQPTLEKVVSVCVLHFRWSTLSQIPPLFFEQLGLFIVLFLVACNDIRHNFTYFFGEAQQTS